MDKAEISIVALLLVALLGNTHAALRFIKDYEHYGGWWWLKLIERRATWTEAFYICRLEGSHLASPGNSVNTGAFEYVQKRYPAGVWTDWHAAPNKTYYSIYLGANIKSFSYYIKSWGKRRDSNSERYLVSMSYYRVRESNGTEDLPFVCGRWGEYWRFGNTACNSYDKEYQLHSTGSCHKLHRAGMEWGAAMIKCRAEGGELAIMNSYQEARIVTSMLAKTVNETGYGGGKVYVGIYYYHTHREGRWVTIHGQHLDDAGFSSMQYYSGADPAHSCGGFSTDGKYLPLNCGVPHRFVCEKKPRTPL